MKKTLPAIITLLNLLVVAALAQAQQAKLALVPQPVSVEPKTGTFALTSQTPVLIDRDSADAANVAKYLVERINRSTGFNLAPTAADPGAEAKGAIVLTTAKANPALGAEGYTLDVSPDGAVIRATAGPGLFYGVQTLLQLFPAEIYGPAVGAKAVVWQAPAVRIEDKPRFAWRGLMLDVSRHFFNKAEVKNFIELLAQHKMNTFHWHLVDDQGWRIEIKAYPKLTQVGAWRSGIGFGLDPKASTAYGPDGRYGGFFTQDDIREVLAYAKDRYITVVPEIEMPGHAVAALAAYPQYSCSGGPYSTDIKAGVNAGVYCAGNDATFQFLEGVLGEVVDLFPSKYIHVGGDEVPKGNWQKCPKCQARMKKEGLKNEHELQSYFITRIEKVLNARGRTLIGWDEILEGGLAPNATVMSWRGIKGGIAAATSGHDVVMTPTSHCYIDYYQAPPAGEPKAIGGFVPLQKVYSFDPVPPELAGANAKHVLGADANLWSEYFPNYAHVQYMAYPRACALAELTWSEAKAKDWNGFSARLDGHLARLKVQNVNYRQPRPGDNTPPPPKKKPAAGKKKKPA